MGGKILKSFTVTQQTSYTSTNSSCTCNVTLDRNIMTDNTTNVPARSGCGLINAEALLGGYE